MRIYNSLTGKKEEFIPINPPQVNIYTCGVTVYDESHIGHARSLYIFDVIRRYLKYRGFQVNFVRNITDIDDKIINRANELKVGWKDLVKKYIDRYDEDLKSLGIDKGDFEPRATENIPEMVKYIQGLIEKGYAYITDSGVYFSVRKFKNYGKMSGQSIEQMLKGVRIEPDKNKLDPLDFALWKKSEPDEPGWDAIFEIKKIKIKISGRPGWHIECSAMSTKYLKTETLDIHAGGRDLIFPHHENEIAQSEALTGKPFAKYWIHHGLLTINDRKMAKSLGNFVSIKDFLKENIPQVLKLFFLSAHYRSPVDYNEKRIREAKKNYERFRILFDKLNRKFSKEKTSAKPVKPDKDSIKFRKRFEETMDDDFNTPEALAVLFDLASFCNKLLDNYKDNYREILLSAEDILQDYCKIFGITFKTHVKEIKSDAYIRMVKGISRTEIESLVKSREDLRKKGNFSEADRIRKRLEEKDIILEDTKEGTIWRRKI